MSEAIRAYPLQWPDGWKRTDSWIRKGARFGKSEFKAVEGGGYNQRKDLSIYDATKRVLYELERLGVSRDDCVISTNLKLRLDGLPRGDQGEPSDPGAAVYWVKKGARRVMAIDAYKTVAGNLGAIAATLEAMRAIERHGGAVILERAFTGFAAIAAPSKWFDVLQVREDSPVDVIQANYRSLAKSRHPDAGGNRGAWDELQRAYDDARKARSF